MAEDQKDRFIQYLAEQHQEDELTKRAMELVLEDLMAEMKELKAQMVVFESNQADVQKELSEKSKLCKSLECKSLERKRNWPMLMSSFLVISVRRRKMIMTELMIRIQFKDTVHQVCMSHAKNKFVKASNQGREPTAERFSEILKEFFMRERKYDDAGLTPKERLRERQILETKELLIELRSLLDSELSRDSEFRSPYYTEALNYLNRFWKEIFAYLDDGELPIDNNLAERTIRKLTTQRNNSLHYGSDAGAEMAATYHSVIGTVKLHGSSVWNFIGTFFKNIFKSLWLLANVKFKTN